MLSPFSFVFSWKLACCSLTSFVGFDSFSCSCIISKLRPLVDFPSSCAQVNRFSLRQYLYCLGLPLAVVVTNSLPARSQIQSDGLLGTSINGGSQSGQSCGSGTCLITGGTDAGSNKFHRFTLFDADSTITPITGVKIKTDSKSNIILGIASTSNGFNLNVPLTLLGSSANLFIVSPRGISLSSGASFSNVIDLTLTNRSSLPIGQSQFSVDSSSIEALSLLTGSPSLDRLVNTLNSSAPSITVGGLSLTIDGSLYVHANSDLTVSNSTLGVPTSLDVGGDLTLSDVILSDTSSSSLYSVGDLSIYDSALNNHSLLKVSSGGTLTISDLLSPSDKGVTISNNSSVQIDSVGDFDISNASIVNNDSLVVNVGGDFYADNILGLSGTGVSLDLNTSVSITAGQNIYFYNSSVSGNESAVITSGGFFNAGSLGETGSYVFGNSFDSNSSLSLTAAGDIDIYGSSINDNAMIAISAGGSFSLYGSDLLRNLPYTTDQYLSDFDTVSALPKFSVDAIDAINIIDSSLDSNGPFTLISSTSDVFISNSDFLDNLYPYVESLTGDISIASSQLSRNAFIDFYAMGDAFVFDASVVGNDLVIGAEQGDSVVISSDLEDNIVVIDSGEGDSFVIDSSSVGNVLDVNSEEGDSVISDSDVVDTDVVVDSGQGDSGVFDSNVDISTLDVTSEGGDATIAQTDVFGSDVFAISEAGDIIIASSNVDESVFEAAALVGNINVLSTDFVDNQQLSFSADFDVTMTDSAVSGTEVVSIDAGNNAVLDSSNISDSDLFSIDVGNELQSESSSFSDNEQGSMTVGSEMSIASVNDGDDASISVSRSNDNAVGARSDQQVAVSSSDDQSSAQESGSTDGSSVSASESDSGDESSSSSESATESQDGTDSESETESSSETSSSAAANDESPSEQSSESDSADSADASVPAVQVKALDAGVVETNLKQSLDSNARQVASALGLDDLPQTPASELTPSRISSRLRQARQVYQFLSTRLSRSRQQSLVSAKTDSLLNAPERSVPFNPAYLNITFTKNADLGIGDVDQGFVDLTLITSNGTVVGRRSELSLKDFSTLLRGFYGKITSQRPLAPSSATSEASRLYSLFLEPIDDTLVREQITTVLVSADRGLQAIPFTALARQGEYVVAKTSFSFTPSLSLTDLSVPLSANDTDGILIMGSSQFSKLAPLPFVGQEVQNIQKFYDGLAVTEDQFTSKRVVEDLQTSSQPLIHLATHADFKGGKPNESMIHTRDGFISFEVFKDIRRERQSDPIDLFVLSACRSALGDRDSEMGLAGMALQAGAKSAIGSLWYVDDVATSAFFSKFYRYLSQGMTKSTALSMTQRDFASGSIKISGSDVVDTSGEVLLAGLSTTQKYNYPKDFRHPFFWSGFVLLGTPW